MFEIQPLTEGLLAEAQALAAELFPWEKEHREALAAAGTGHDAAAFLAPRGLSRVRVWCLTRDEQVAGLTSLYEYRSAPDEVWLAWFGLSPEVRGHGLGSTLLDGVISLARRETKAVIRLWTTIEDEYATALQLYARRGFRPEIQPALPGDHWQTVVCSLALQGGVCPPWRGSLNGAHLCGRVAPAVAA